MPENSVPANRVPPNRAKHENPAGTAAVAAKRPAWQRIVVLVFVCFFAWHGYATVAWLSGSATLMRIGPVEQYMDPLFRQNWSVFAPNPEDFNTMVQVRAELADGTETEWFDVTQQDLEDSIQGIPLLSRMYQSNFMLALHTLNDTNQITDEERDIVLGVDDAGTDEATTDDASIDEAGSGEAVSEADITAALESLGSAVDEGYLERVLNENASLTMIASEVAKARWADSDAASVEAVQYRILVVETPRAPWAGEGPEAYLFDWEPGWRAPIWHEGINTEEFVDRYGPERTNDQAVVTGAGDAS